MACGTCEDCIEKTKSSWSGVKVEKCKFFKKDAAFFGRFVYEHGYRIDPENTKAVSTLKGNPTKTVGDVRRIVGLLSYYRHYIKNFAKIAKPLYKSLQVPKSGGKPRTTQKVNVLQETR